MPGARRELSASSSPIGTSFHRMWCLKRPDPQDFVAGADRFC